MRLDEKTKRRLDEKPRALRIGLRMNSSFEVNFIETVFRRNRLNYDDDEDNDDDDDDNS